MMWSSIGSSRNFPASRLLGTSEPSDDDAAIAAEAAVKPGMKQLRHGLFTG
jgi:hypothetical protein